jgi:hypothetical protein
MTATCTITGFERADRRERRGVTLFELLVAFSLLATLVSASAGLVVRHGRLLSSARNQRLAIEELANQMELVTALPPEQVAAFIAAPTPSPLARAHLSGVALAATLSEPAAADQARRIVLAIEWNEPGRRGNPLRLAGWLRGQAPAEVTP